MEKSNKIVAIVFHDSDRFYSGGTRSMLDLLETWITDKHMCFVAIFPKNGTAVNYVKKFGIPVIVSRYYTNKKPRDIKGFLYFKGLIKHTVKFIISKFNVNLSIAPELRRLKVNVIYSNTSINYVGVLIKKKISVPLIWHIRESIEYNKFADMWGGMKYYYKVVNKYADKVILISEALSEIYINKIRIELIRVVYDDISPTFINPIKSSSNSVNILVAGFIDSSKGQLDVIKAVNKLVKKGLDRLRLFIAGSGDQKYLKKINDYIHVERIENYVKLLGNVEDMNKLRQKMHIGVVATKFEAFGRISIEGMLSKMVMIGSNKGANPELYDHGKYGLLYELGDESALAILIEELYINKLKRIEISENSFRFAKKFTKGIGASKIKEIFHEI